MYIKKEELSVLKDLFIKEPQWVTYGLFFGFPICCIKDFIETPFDKRKYYKKGKHTGTGYIPCSKCIAPINENWSLFQKNIKKRRISPTPFPIDDDHPSINYFFIYLTDVFQLNITNYMEYFHRNEEISVILKNNNYENEIIKIKTKFKFYKERKIKNSITNVIHNWSTT